MLVVIDLQERLIPHIVENENIVKRTAKLIRACKILGLPIIATKQVKLGKIVPEISDLLDEEPIEKVTFSCCGSEEFLKKLESFEEKECILVGIETHICVLQTAIDLLKMGYRVYLAVDCTGSRNTIDRDVAIRRMIMEGVIPTTAETIIYEFMRTAEFDRFKDILGIIKE